MKAESEFDQLCSARRVPPAMPSAEFIDMCKQLRALGAVKVAHGDFSAEFVPVTAAFVQERQPEPDEKPLTPEQAREAQRRRELGL